MPVRKPRRGSAIGKRFRRLAGRVVSRRRCLPLVLLGADIYRNHAYQRRHTCPDHKNTCPSLFHMESRVCMCMERVRYINRFIGKNPRISGKSTKGPKRLEGEPTGLAAELSLRLLPFSCDETACSPRSFLE